MPARQGNQTAGSGNGGYIGACEAVQPPPRGLGWPRPASGDGLKYLFTIINRSTRWLEEVPVKNVEATTAADALITDWVSCFGVPAVITSDRGTQFTSAVWEVLCTRLGIDHITTMAFHPCNNGMVERAQRQLKDTLRK